MIVCNLVVFLLVEKDRYGCLWFLWLSLVSMVVSGFYGCLWFLWLSLASMVVSGFSVAAMKSSICSTESIWLTSWRDRQGHRLLCAAREWLGDKHALTIFVTRKHRTSHPETTINTFTVNHTRSPALQPNMLERSIASVHVFLHE